MTVRAERRRSQSARGVEGAHLGRANPDSAAQDRLSGVRDTIHVRPTSSRSRIDSTVIRARYQAAGACEGTPRQGLGRSKSGLVIEIHLRVNGADLPIRSDITIG